MLILNIEMDKTRRFVDYVSVETSVPSAKLFIVSRVAASILICLNTRSRKLVGKNINIQIPNSAVSFCILHLNLALFNECAANCEHKIF